MKVAEEGIRLLAIIGTIPFQNKGEIHFCKKAMEVSFLYIGLPIPERTSDDYDIYSSKCIYYTRTHTHTKEVGCDGKRREGGVVSCWRIGSTGPSRAQMAESKNRAAVCSRSDNMELERHGQSGTRLVVGQRSAAQCRPFISDTLCAIIPTFFATKRAHSENFPKKNKDPNWTSVAVAEGRVFFLFFYSGRAPTTTCRATRSIAVYEGCADLISLMYYIAQPQIQRPQSPHTHTHTPKRTRI